VDPQNVEVFDSRTSTLFKAVLKGAGRKPIKGERKDEVKVFAKTNLSEDVPNFICICPESTNENMFLKVIQLKEFRIVVFDKGYNCYLSFAKWTDANKYFITKEKDNVKYEVVMGFDCTHSPDILSDQLILLKYKENGLSRTAKVSLVVYTDPQSCEKLEFISNLMGHEALTIAQLYKNRWIIEV